MARLVLFALVAFVHGELSAREAVLLASPDALRLRSHLYNITRFDHLMGSPGDWRNAEYVRAELERCGFDAWIEKVPVMLTFPDAPPTLTAVDDAGTLLFSAKLAEDVLPQDETSDNQWRNVTFNAYSPSGSVSARLVYANYGMPSDFDALQEAGVDVRGAVVLTRYGGCFRGLKAMNAEARGAAATLIYSDPAEDGFALGPTFPEGPFLSLCAGDPFRLYLDGAEDPCGVEFIPKKPVLPLSYADAAPLLARLGGPDAPPAFRGALNLTYTLGPSVGWRVEMTTSNAFEPGAIPNVIAVLNGTDGGYGADTARPVLAGNHRDAWVLGAVDPHSGTVALLETARALFQLKVDDPSWRPRRTIVLCSWTGEEYGLIGSTAFTELHADLLRNAVAYVNVDVAVSGSHHLTAAGTQTLDALFAHAARDVTHAVGGALGEVSLESLWAAADDDEDAKAAMADVSKLGTLGSGSDYTAFIDALGIASIDFSFVGPEGGAYGTYHSVYDSFTYVETVVDPDFKTHVSAAKLFALLVYRLADEAVLDFKLSTQARAVDAYVAELRAGAALNFAPLEAAAIRFAIGAACADAAALNATAETAPKINDHLAFTERRFLADGLPQRPWYKHVLQAPGFYLGYGSTAFPGVAHAFEDGDFESAQTQIGIAAGRIAAAADFLAELC